MTSDEAPAEEAPEDEAPAEEEPTKGRGRQAEEPAATAAGGEATRTTADGGTDESTDAAVSSARRRRSDPDADSSPLPDPDAVARYLQWGALVGFVILGIIAATGLYTSAGRVIEVWVAQRYQPVVRTVFNASLLLVAAAGASAVLSRLDGET